MIQVEVFSTSNRKLGEISVTEGAKVKDIKNAIAKVFPKLYPDRQSIRSEAKGKNIKDDSFIDNLGNTKKVFVKDLGPQIGWDTVFLLEYAGPFVLYGLVAMRPWIFYGDLGKQTEMTPTAKIALLCWSFHYLKRILETLFVHRFSHGTMPLRNLFRNCSYYWGFCVYVAYHTNHPLFTPPSILLQVIGLSTFVLCELGNLSIHLLLKNLRPPGTTVRKIPMPDGNPFTSMLNLVSCPNYTYEVGAWLGFTILTSCLPAGLFTLAGFYQMTVWALDKHRAYKKEFPNYPKNRKSIVPFLI